MSGYTKLFSSIVTSTVWREPDHVRLVWITLLALSDKWGLVECSIPGLADMARVTVGQCQDALRVLMSPDEFSRTKFAEGRRLREVEGGWELINHNKYRDKMSADERRVYNALKQRERRERLKQERLSLTINDTSAESAHTEAEAEAETKAKINPSRASRAIEAIEFETFWDGYPRKVAKAAALKAWNRLKPNADLRIRISAALELQQRSGQWTKDGGQFIPHAATWLNQRRWEDELPTSKPAGAEPVYADWREECQRLHGGTCSKQYAHAEKMGRGA